MTKQYLLLGFAGLALMLVSALVAYSTFPLMYGGVSETLSTTYLCAVVTTFLGFVLMMAGLIAAAIEHN